MQTSLKEQIELLESFKRMLTKHHAQTMEIVLGAAIFGDHETIAKLMELAEQCNHEHQMCCDIIDTLHAVRLTERVDKASAISIPSMIGKIEKAIATDGPRGVIEYLNANFKVYRKDDVQPTTPPYEHASVNIKSRIQDIVHGVIDTQLSMEEKTNLVEKLFNATKRMVTSNTTLPLLLNKDKFENDLIDALESGPGMLDGRSFTAIVTKALAKQNVKWQ